MNTRPATGVTTRAGSCLLPSSLGWATMRNALVIGLPLLMLTACSPHPPQANSPQPSSAQAQPDTCAPSQLVFSLDSGNGRFNGMSHSGTMLVLRNTGTAACVIPTQPPVTFKDENGQPLEIAAQDSPDSPSASAPISLASGATVTNDMRWVSSDVYDNGHCDSPAYITLAIGEQVISTAFAGHLCGTGGKPSTYTLASFKPAKKSAPASVANTITYTCDDQRTVKAVYPDRDTAVLTFDGDTHHLHVARSADGARYVGDQWQWWTKGMHEGRLAPLEAGETIASAKGVSCTAP